MSTTREIVPFSETISQTAGEGFGVGGEVIAKSEMPEIGYSGETSQPGQEGLGVGGEVVAKSEMPEIGHSDVETSHPVVSGSTSETSMGAAFDCDPKSEQMGGVHSKGKSSDARTQNPDGLDEMRTAGTLLQSVVVQLYEAPRDSEWFDAIEKKNCKVLLQLFRSDRRLWVRTGFKGRSVLHVAVMQGCSELVRELHKYEGDLVFGKKWRTPFEFLWENARDGRLKDASVQDLWFVMEGPSVKIQNQKWYDRKLSTDRSRSDYLKSHVECTMSVDDEMMSLRDVINSIAVEKDFRMDENDVDFNFENVERKELYMHMACSMLRNAHKQEDWEIRCLQIIAFIMAVFTDLGGKHLLEKLFDQKDAQGRTILQNFVPYQQHLEYRKIFEKAFLEMLNILPETCVNALDKAGRTILHWAVAHQCDWMTEALLKSKKVKRNIQFQTVYISKITALHLPLLYNYDVSIPFLKYFQNQLKNYFCNFKSHEPSIRFPRILEWAVLNYRNKFLKKILQNMMSFQSTQENFLSGPELNHLLGVAATSGNAEILQLLLQKDDIEINGVSNECKMPVLHNAVYSDIYTTNYQFVRSSRYFDDVVHCNDFISIKLLEEKLGDRCTYVNKYSGKQACANLLLQAGADILATNSLGCMADPGSNAPNDARIWWYELVAKETLNMKNDLNAAGTGTAVVATLVATASFVGPLQPPLNYVVISSGIATIDVGVQVTELLIRVFLISNALSFYLAITSIMLAIMPSLPIPKEGLVLGPCSDIKRSRRTISIAIGMLLASIMSVLISFAASSLVVTPLQHRRLMAYSTAIGGLICCIGIFFFFLRCLRLIRPRNTVIKKLYRKIGKL